MNTNTLPFILKFFVPGSPIPKQSFKVSAKGQGYTPDQVNQWERDVRILANNAMQLQDQDQTTRPLRVMLEFILPDRRRRDLDNLSKAILDGMKGSVYADDDQIIELNARKVYTDEMPKDGSTPAGVSVYVHER